MDTKANTNSRDAYDLSALAEAMLLTEERLPASLSEDLQTLRQMLEGAVRAGEGAETSEPSAPFCGKNAAAGERADSLTVVLRRDEAETRTESLIGLSSRRVGEYIAVPQVVGQGGNT